MKILTSYFYQIRFFTPRYIPLSTAMWDPKWYHQDNSQSFKFLDKNGVINGLRATPFVPNKSCDGLCRGPRECVVQRPQECEFLTKYYTQLKELDFNEMLRRFENVGNSVKNELKFEEDPILVLIFHETGFNPCSERQIVKKWFHENGIELEEFDRLKIK